MSNEVQARTLTNEDLATLEKAGVIPPNSDPAQVGVFSRVCKEKSLSPFSKQIHLTRYNTKDGPKYTIIVGIDGYRSIASRTGLHAGTDDAKFDLLPDGSFKTAAQLATERRLPVSATVTAWKVVANQRVSFTHTAVFAEFSTGQQKWQSMPIQMIAKCAEAFALKKGWPDELSGLHVEEEIGAFEDKQIAATPGRVVEQPLTDKEQDRWQDTVDALTNMDYAQVVKYWTDFKTGELANKKPFIILFAAAGCSKATDVEQLSELWGLLGKWTTNQDVKKYFTDRRKVLAEQQSA